MKKKTIKKIYKAIVAIATIYGLALLAGEPLPGEEINIWLFLGLKVLGFALMAGGLYLLGAYRSQNNNV